MPRRCCQSVVRFCIPVLLVVVLAACGGGSSEPNPTTELTTAATMPLAPGQKSVGDLLDGIAAASTSIQSARTIFTTRTLDETPTASTTTTEEFIFPESRRIQTASGSTILDDQIAIGSAVYLRGSFVTSAVAPMVGPDVWVTVDPQLVPSDTPVGNVIGYLTGPFQLPFASVSEEMRARGVSHAGQIEAAGRTCTVWTFVDSTDFGDRIDYALAIDPEGLPCSLVERAGNVENVTTFEFNIPGMTIVAPDSAQAVSGTPEG